jgi:hypothetical protein
MNLLGFQIRAHEWLFSSEEGQWIVVENSKAARLIMVHILSLKLRPNWVKFGLILVLIEA